MKTRESHIAQEINNSTNKNISQVNSKKNKKNKKKQSVNKSIIYRNSMKFDQTKHCPSEVYTIRYESV